MPKQNEVHKPRKQMAVAAGLAVTAAAAGAVAALLMAPKSGRETRRDIKNRANDAKQKGRDRAEDLKEDARDRLHRVRDKYESNEEENAEAQSARRGFWGRK